VKHQADNKYDPYDPEQLTITQLRLPHLTQERRVGIDFAGTVEDLKVPNHVHDDEQESTAPVVAVTIFLPITVLQRTAIRFAVTALGAVCTLR
jgi:hypothetical protein